MNIETREALVTVLKNARKYAGELNKKKRQTQQEVFDLAVLYRDLVTIEQWVEKQKITGEVSKEINEMIMEAHGIKLVTCPNCGGILSITGSSEEYTCPHCNTVDEPSQFPDLFY